MSKFRSGRSLEKTERSVVIEGNRMYVSPVVFSGLHEAGVLLDAGEQLDACKRLLTLTDEEYSVAKRREFIVIVDYEM